MPSWDEESMESAIERVITGHEPMRNVATSCGIPLSTLGWRVRCARDEMTKPVLNIGRPTVFTTAEEKVLANVVKLAQERLLPMTANILKSHIQEVLLEEVSIGIRRNIPEGFKNYYPTKKWLQGFMKRNNISFRSPESYSKSRGNVTKEDIKQWFSVTKEYLDSEPDLKEAINDPNRVFNIDETGARISPTSGKVLAIKGRRDVGQIAIGNEKSSITVLANICCNGKWVSPLLMLPYKRLPSNVVQSVPDWVVIGSSPKGWISSGSLYEYLCNSFDNWLTENNVPRPVVVWSDWHSTRLNYHTISETLSRGIILMGLPKNCTHLMQPLDTHIFGPMKSGWKEEVAKLTLNDVELKKDTFGEHFFKFYEQFMNDRSAIFPKSFEDTGLCPLNSEKPRYGKLKSQGKCSQPTEGVEYRSVGIREGHHNQKTYKKTSTQTENVGVLKGTSTSPAKSETTGNPDAPFLAMSTDDMVLHLSSEKINKASIQARAEERFAPKQGPSSIIRSRSDLFISDVFAGHKFFPSPCVAPTNDRRQKTKAVELLPNAISSKEWKLYAEEKRKDKQTKKRKNDEDDASTSVLAVRPPEPKRRRGRPRKNPVGPIRITNASHDRTATHLTTASPEISIVNIVSTVSSDDNEDEPPSFSTPVDNKADNQCSAAQINTIKKPKRLVFGKTSILSAEIQEGEYVEVSDQLIPGKVTKLLRTGKMLISLMEKSDLMLDGWRWPQKPMIQSFMKEDVKRCLDSPHRVEADKGLVFRFEPILQADEI